MSAASRTLASRERRFKTQAEARIAVFEFIEGFYNPRRRRSPIGYLSPMDDERHTADPEAHQSAAMLAAAKDKPFGRPPSGAVLDRRCARRRRKSAVGAEESLRRGRTKERARTSKKVSEKSVSKKERACVRSGD